MSLVGCSSSPQSPLQAFCAKQLSCFGDTIPSSQGNCEDLFARATEIQFAGECSAGLDAMSCEEFATTYDECLVGAQKPHPSTTWLVIKTALVVLLGLYLLGDQRILLGYMLFAGAMTMLGGVWATIASGIFAGAERQLILDLEACTPSFGFIPPALSHLLLGFGFIVAAKSDPSWFTSLFGLANFVGGILQFFDSPMYAFVDSVRAVALPGGVFGGLLAIGVQLALGVYTIYKAGRAWDSAVASRRRA